jgi:KaiC/GvpD/RAD55 family RecA-like ATPase
VSFLARQEPWTVTPRPERGAFLDRLYVFPLRSAEDKSPAEKGWQDRVALFGERETKWPGRDAFGAPHGPRNESWVLDIDLKKNGPARLAELEAKYGKLPETRRARTRGGGWHYWFAWDPARPVVTRRDVLRAPGAKESGIDTRGEGGLSVVPPSAGYTWESAAPLAPAPDWVYELLSAPEPVLEEIRKARALERPEWGENVSEDLAAKRSADAEHWLFHRHVDGRPPKPGEESDWLCAAAGHLVRGYLLEVDEAARLMQKFLDANDLDDVLRGDGRYRDEGVEGHCNRAENGGIYLPSWGAMLQSNRELWPAGWRWNEGNKTWERDEAPATLLPVGTGEGPDGAPKPAAAEPFAIPMPEFLAQHIEPPRDLVWKLQAGQLAFMYGGPNSCKTWFALELARQVAERGHVVTYIVEEGHPSQLQRRFATMGLTNPHFLVRARKRFQLNSPQWVGSLLAHCAATGTKLLVIDPLSDCLEGVDESNPKEMAPVRDMLKRLTGAGLCTLVLHHSSKMGSRQSAQHDVGPAMENMRGHSILAGAADLMVELRREKAPDDVEDSPVRVAQTHVEVTKNRNGSLEFDSMLRVEIARDRATVTYLNGKLGKAKRDEQKDQRADDRKARAAREREDEEGRVVASLRAKPMQDQTRLRQMAGVGEKRLREILRDLKEAGRATRSGNEWSLVS